MKMKHPPITRELQPLFRPQASTAAEGQRPRTARTTDNPDLVAVVAFCLIGLLLALNLMLRFPEFGAVIEQYNLF